jgi:amino acid transporter
LQPWPVCSLGQEVFIVTVNLLFVGFISLLSLLNIKTIGKIQNAGTIFKIIPLVLVLAIFIAYWNPNFQITLPSLGYLPSLVPLALFGFWGFEVCCTISHLIKGDPRNASRAILIAFAVITVLYSMFHFGVLHIMGLEKLAASGSARDFVFYLGFSPYLQALFNSFISITIALVFMNAIFSIFTATSSMLQAMGQENILPYSKKLTKQSKQQRPWIAIIIQGVLTFGITCMADKSHKAVFVSMINLGILLTFFLTLIALFILQKRTNHTKQVGITLLAFGSWAMFVYFSWNDLASTNMMRILASIPLIAALAIGYMMYLYKVKSVPSKIRPNP